ncbi:MAG: thioesterase family protein [Pseudomonadota bacterium]
MHDFEQDTQLVTAGGQRWSFALSDRWNVGAIPNGGYLMAAAAKAMAQAVSHRDPLTITGHYLRPAEAGTAEIEATPVKQGSTFDNVQASILQQGRERCRFLAAFGTLDTLEGQSWHTEPLPDMPPPEACVSLKNTLAISQRYETYFDPVSAGWMRGETAELAEFRVWIGHADRRAPDLYSLLLFADALPPPVFNRIGPRGWVPTVELTVHLRARPAPGLVRARFRTRYVTRGLLESDGELWDARGELVALSRQLARLRD